ncbi:Unknown protein sequence [Pseudomonas coronafaciens pv. oryzae]|nr:Unknown protein sequence [Pseudomonas coronafaciens pv. oryzae]
MHEHPSCALHFAGFAGRRFGQISRLAARAFVVPAVIDLLDTPTL